MTLGYSLRPQPRGTLETGMGENVVRALTRDAADTGELGVVGARLVRYNPSSVRP
jgi:hypothetical protein